MTESKYIKKVGNGINLETDGDGGGAGGAEIKTFETTATLTVAMGIGGATITLPDTIEVNKILSIEMQMEIGLGTFAGGQLPYCDVDANDGVFSIRNYMSFEYLFEKEPFNIQEIRLKAVGQDFTNNMTLPLVISYV